MLSDACYTSPSALHLVAQRTTGIHTLLEQKPLRLLRYRAVGGTLEAIVEASRRLYLLLTLFKPRCVPEPAGRGRSCRVARSDSMAYQKKYFLGRYVCRTTIPCPNCPIDSRKTREPHRERVPAHIKTLDNMAWEFSGETISFFANGVEVNGAGSSSTVVGASATISCLRTNIFCLAGSVATDVHGNLQWPSFGQGSLSSPPATAPAPKYGSPAPLRRIPHCAIIPVH